MPLKLFKRPESNIWWISGTIRGQRVRESTGTDDDALAEEYRATREAKLYRSALHGERPPVTFASAIVSYTATKGQISLGTKLRLNKLLRYAGPRTVLGDIDQTWIDGACAALLRPGVKPATRRREVVTPVHAVLQHAARRGWCAQPQFEPLAASPQRTAWLTPTEADRLIAEASPHLRPLLTFLLATGARLGEALSLDWRDVDLPHCRALLRKTKNGRDRIVDLCPRAVAAMVALAWHEGAVFRSDRKDERGIQKPYAVRRLPGGGQIKHGFMAARTRAKLPEDISPHSLRHTWATWHYAMHRDLLRLKEEGGWSSVQLVERYAHLPPESMGPEVEAWRAACPILTQRRPSDLAQGAN